MFSIILPLYNKERSIESTILSILNQTLIDFELIVIDDGSKDQSIHLVRNIKDKRLSIYCKENGGVSSARNFGIGKAKFEYICFIDGDDIWEPTYLQKMSELISLYPKAGIYGSAWAYRYRDKIVTPNFYIKDRSVEIENYFSHAYKHTLFSSSSVIIRKYVFDKVGLFDERIKMGEDLDMWIRINIQFKAAFLNEVLAYYVMDAANRACAVLCPLDKHLLMYLEKFDCLRKENVALDIYVGHYCLRQGVPYYFHSGCKDRIRCLLMKLSLSNYPFFWRIIYSSQLWRINCWIYTLYKRLR
ncbi:MULTISPECIES: glycosyltransferase family 2 protein [Bacteroides]|uniref:glycosyltransferase family 2 protein n=1 Tax=Bacteroides TaxID=816 RepID=UPI00189B48E6|nr:glycosyltransferase [Bacteroides fragilis]MCS2614828.1 glycosyltransferase [Bacteroides fragilis]MCS2878165.1 glycosyltransferase [Bacteroides fragilis]